MIAIPQSIARIPILRGLLRLAITGYARITRGRYLVEERMGLRLLIDQENVIDRQIFLSGTWEKDHLDTLFGLVEKHRRPGEKAVFLDIGAHWGLYALLACKSGIFERIVAFEPDPTNYAQLQANLFLNGAENTIEAHRLAASDSERTFGLYLRTHLNRGATQLVETGLDGQGTCRAVRVDNLLDFEGKLLVIKMDVEGHELEAIGGLLGLLAKNRCVLQVEIWGFPEEERPRRYKILEPLLARYGMTCVHAIVADHFFVPESPPEKVGTGG
jgi:FkbM family methyltransferase